MSNARTSRNVAEIRRAQLNGVSVSRHGGNVLASLRATTIVTSSKPVLPAELIATILDYVPVADLMRCARISKRLQEMVHDDTRWIQKLKAMGVWNENEARQHFDNAMRKKKDNAEAAPHKARHTEVLEGQAGGVGEDAGSGQRRHAGSITLYDVGVEEEKLRRLSMRDQHRTHVARRQHTDGFQEVSTASTPSRPTDPRAALTIFEHVHSIRGRARQEFGKVYASLGPLYQDLAQAQAHSDPMLFRIFNDPEDQAQILSSLKRFALHDTALGHAQRQGKVDVLIDVFEKAVLREFEQGIAARDVDGRMKRYAHVLYTLNGGQSSVETFISSHAIMQGTMRLGSPMDCIEDVAPGHVDLNASQRFFDQLTQVCREQANIIQRIFPPSVDALTPFLQRLCSHILADYLTTLFDEAHRRQAMETYVKAVSGTFAQALHFAASLTATPASPNDFAQSNQATVTACFEKHIDLYLAEELALFKSRCQIEVEEWEKAASEEQATAELFFMSNVSRQAAKRDFLSSFKKVVMMPVNVFPFTSAKPIINRTTADLQHIDTVYSRSQSPALTDTSTPNRASLTARPEAPTTELAAKTAIMNSRLEGIKSLFSIEVALNVTHFAKASLERAAVIVKMGGRLGDEARQQCETIFVELLHILGTRHVKAGFDKAVEHLSTYDPKQVREYRSNVVLEHEENAQQQVAGVEPLMTFLELVNVGDLIQQMVDVFYNEELLSTKLIERDDFLDPAVKEKKRFEQMLDERVAAGLSKGIDVLMDEVEFLCATTQPATDFNPPPGQSVMDIGPSVTAKQVIDIVSSHTSMLLGSTDKTMLDVFMQEVGLRLFGVLCKHIKRQRISVDGAIKLICDVNHYSAYIASLRQKPIQPYYSALRELGQIYLVYIEPPASVFGSGGGTTVKNAKRGSGMLSIKASKTQSQAKELATIIADHQRYYGIIPTEEVYEFAERRADWYLVKGDVERAMYGAGCSVM